MGGSKERGDGSLCERAGANRRKCSCGDCRSLWAASTCTERSIWSSSAIRRATCWPITACAQTPAVSGKIETLFQALKGRGFDLESCHLVQARRLSGWFGFLALGLCWCLKVGRCLDEKDPLPLKKQGRRAVSVFQRGFRLLQSLLACLAGRPQIEHFQQAIAGLCLVK